MRLYGFTLLRNAIQYDYPYEESLRSLGGIVEKTYIALGRSEDGTEAALGKIPNVVTVPTVWDENLRKSGLILSQQTNIALEALRGDLKSRGELEGAWGFYLQADEAICELDYETILNDIRRAENEGCDAVRFRYLHFWQSYDRIAIGKRWYPQEIRAVRLASRAESYGDAQSFRGVAKVLESDAHIFHYGHVREQVAYEKKKREFHRWWHSDEEMKGVIARGEKTDRSEETLLYLGPHPEAMEARMRASGHTEPPWAERVGFVGRPEALSEKFLKTVRARRIDWGRKRGEVAGADPVVVLEETLFTRLLGLGRESRIPRAMKSPLARPWTAEFRALLKLSQKGVACRP